MRAKRFKAKASAGRVNGEQHPSAAVVDHYKSWAELRETGTARNLLSQLDLWYPPSNRSLRDLVVSTRRWLTAAVAGEHLPLAKVGAAAIMVLKSGDCIKGFVIHMEGRRDNVIIVRTIKASDAYRGTGTRLLQSLFKSKPRATFVVEGSMCTARLRGFYESCGFHGPRVAAGDTDYVMVRTEKCTDVSKVRSELRRLA